MLLQALWHVCSPRLCVIELTIARPIQSKSPLMGNKIVLKLGVFPKVPRPEWEAFAVRRQAWEVPFEGCIQYKLLGGPGKEQLK
jgi:hypothetical protein